MTDIVRKQANAATRRPPAPGTETDDTDLLVLDGPDPKTVLVRARELNGKTIAEFAHQPESDRDWYTGGLKWVPSGGHSMFVKFSFEASSIATIVAVECNLPTSPPYSPDNGPPLSRQDICILPASHADVQYQFWVKFHNGQRHDPKILVTPINN